MRRYLALATLALLLSACGFELRSGHAWTATYSWSCAPLGGYVVHATAENVSERPIRVQWNDAGEVVVEPGETDRFPLYGSPASVELRVDGGLDEEQAPNDVYVPRGAGVCP